MFSEFESFLAILINSKKLIATTITNEKDAVNVTVDKTPRALITAAFGPTIWIIISFGIALSTETILPAALKEPPSDKINKTARKDNGESIPTKETSHLQP